MTKKKKAEVSKIQKISTALGNVYGNEKLAFGIGLILMALAVYFTIAFISYFTTGSIDQSYIDNIKPGEVVDKAHDFANKCGSWGAFSSDFFIRKGFGIASFALPFMLLLLGIRMMQVKKINIIKWFFGTMIIMIWSSVFMAKFVSPLFASSWFNPGGEHGLFICNYVEGLIGMPGLSAILIITAICFLTYVSAETIIVVRKVLNPVKFFTDRVKFTVSNHNPADEPANVEEELGIEDPDVFDDPSSQVVEFTDEGANIIDNTTPMDGQNNSNGNNIDDEIIAGNVGKNGGDNGSGYDINDHAKGDDVELDIEEGREEDKANSGTIAEQEDTMAPYDPKRDLENYHYPTLDLLKKYENDGKPYIDMVEQNKNKNRIVEVLRNFGVEISSIKATVGPTITLYEITPAQGVRISKIRNLEDDIALSLSALGIRIIAPIPGKGTIGIEVPNAKPNIVSMESILNSRKFQESKMELPCAVGKTITNEVFMFDLAKIPHLLVAGATGQGKSVGLNAILTSLLYKKHPAELKIVLIDPKKVEFSIYAPIANHFLAKVPDEDSEPIITDVTKVVRTLNSLCKEMDTRYDLLKSAGARNIKEYNAKFIGRQLNPNKGHRFMPYIVVVIDEFGDLIMTAGKEIELPIARIAQLARAVGIHMVIATQRPTTTIITGNIKANFPGRIAFKVSAMIDSKTILDRPGANQLIGRGDMLFLNGAEPVRVQCAFVDTPEVEQINAYIAKQQGYSTPFELPEPDTDMGDGIGGGADVDIQHLDPLFDEAARHIVLNQSGSTSLIQRKFSIGYNRAGRLMDQMEKVGIVGAASGGKPREVLIQDEVSLDNLLAQLHNRR